VFLKLGGSLITDKAKELFCYLAKRIAPGRILLAGEVDGIFTADPLRDPEAKLVTEITPSQTDELTTLLPGSYGPDVTGGMAQKVRLTLELVRKMPGTTVLIMSGRVPGNVKRALLGFPPSRCTVIKTSCAPGGR